jgi:hypothetical protein
MRLVTLASEPRDLCFVIGNGETATVRGLCRRLMASRFDRFAIGVFPLFCANKYGPDSRRGQAGVLS